MLNTVKKTIKSYQMLSDDRPIVIGVSGGPDSMALLHILSQLVPNRLIAAHLNHRFRGHEADLDAELVRDECNKLGIPFVLKEYDVPKYMEERKLGAQIAAREIRYHFYEEVVNDWNAGYLALGHHQNDQAETVMMRILRGTGIHGLSGIPYVRVYKDIKIIRPLLDLTRKEIEDYVKKEFVPFRTDQSNFSTKYFRNAIRLTVLPFLEKFSPNLISHLHQLAKISQAEDDFLQKIAHEQLSKCLIKKEQDTFILGVSSLQDLDIALQRRVIHLILSYLNLAGDFTQIHVEMILSIINQTHPSKTLDLPHLLVYREYDKLIFSKAIAQDDLSYSYVLPVPGVLEIPQIRKKFTTQVSQKVLYPKGIWEVFDYPLFQENEIIVRNRKSGDRIQIKGMDGRKKVKNIFIDEKIPKRLRSHQPIIEANGQIIWIPGIKKSNLNEINKNTTSYLYIIMEDF